MMASRGGENDIDAAVERLTNVLKCVLGEAVSVAAAVDAERLTAIREFYLDPKPSYSLTELADLWLLSVDDICDVFRDEMENAGGCRDRFRVPWAEAVTAVTAHQFFRAIEVERALGPEFERVRTSHWRTTPLLVHIPRFIIAHATTGYALVAPSHTPLAARLERMIMDFAEGECLIQNDFDREM